MTIHRKLYYMLQYLSEPRSTSGGLYQSTWLVPFAVSNIDLMCQARAIYAHTNQCFAVIYVVCNQYWLLMGLSFILEHLWTLYLYYDEIFYERNATHHVNGLTTLTLSHHFEGLTTLSFAMWFTTDIRAAHSVSINDALYFTNIFVWRDKTLANKYLVYVYVQTMHNKEKNKNKSPAQLIK